MSCNTCDENKCIERCDKEYQQNQETIASIMVFINSLSLEQLKIFKRINSYFYMYRDVIYNKTFKRIEELEK